MDEITFIPSRPLRSVCIYGFYYSKAEGIMNYFEVFGKQNLSESLSIKSSKESDYSCGFIAKETDKSNLN